MNAGELALEMIPLLAVDCLGPGLLIVRWLKWSPLEKLCTAFAISLILTYLASFALFCAEAGTWAYWAVSGVFLVMGCLGWPQLRLILRQRRSRTALFAYLAVASWDFLHLAMSRHFGGGMWEGDWHEHYTRTVFFLHEFSLPKDFSFLGLYLLPARPPMMNLIVAFHCRQVGMCFEAFSLSSLVLNSFAFLPCCLLLGYLGKRSGRNIVILAVLFMLNPSAVQNATYTWTKALTAGFVILGVYFYLRGMRSQNGPRLIAASLSLAAGILVHYSAVPFCIAIAVHYVVTILRGRAKLSLAVISGICAVVLLSTWFGWSFHVYGVRDTLFSNTTATQTGQQTLADNLAKIAYNMFTTLVPYPLHPGLDIFPADDIRDYFFMVTQTTLTAMVGCTGGLIAAIFLVGYFLSDDARAKQDKLFWAIFLSMGFVLGIAVNGQKEVFGAAHVTLQTLGLMGVTLIAARLTVMNVILYWLIIVGSAVDYALGIFLNFDHRATIFPPVGDPDVWYSRLLNLSRGFDGREFAVKMSSGFHLWGDHLSDFATVLEGTSVVIAVIALYVLLTKRQEVEHRNRIRPKRILKNLSRQSLSE